MSFEIKQDQYNFSKIKKEYNKSIQHILKNKTYLSLPKNIDNNDLYSSDNIKCNIPFNQIGTIDKYGILYFYDDKGIYFFDSNNIKHLLCESKIENSFLFYLKSNQSIFKVSVLNIKTNENISNNNINNNMDYLVIIIKGEKGNFIVYINIDNLFLEISRQEAVNIRNYYHIINDEEEKIDDNNNSKDKTDNKNNYIISNDISFSLYPKKENNFIKNDKEKNIIDKNNENENNKENKEVNLEEEDNKEKEIEDNKGEYIKEDIPLDLNFVLNIESMIFPQYYEPNKYLYNTII